MGIVSREKSTSATTTMPSTMAMDIGLPPGTWAPVRSGGESLDAPHRQLMDAPWLISEIRGALFTRQVHCRTGVAFGGPLPEVLRLSQLLPSRAPATDSHGGTSLETTRGNLHGFDADGGRWRRADEEPDPAPVGVPVRAHDAAGPHRLVRRLRGGEEAPDGAGGEGGHAHPLNQEKRPGCYLHRSNPNDVARTEHLTFICTPSQDGAGPTNNWMEPEEAYAKLRPLFDGCMKGRTMYVVPFVMGPLGCRSRRSACSSPTALRRGQHGHHDPHGRGGAWSSSATRDDFTRCLHSTGDCQPRPPLHLPLPAGQHDLELRLRLRRQRAAGQEVPGAAHRQLPRPRSRAGWPSTCCSWASTDPEGEKTYVAAAFPSRLRQDELRHADPAGASIARAGRSRRSATTSPGCGSTRTAGCARSTRRRATSASCPAPTTRPTPTPWRPWRSDTIYTNVALHARRRRVVGGQDDEEPPPECIDWTGPAVDAGQTARRRRTPTAASPRR